MTDLTFHSLAATPDAVDPSARTPAVDRGRIAKILFAVALGVPLGLLLGVFVGLYTGLIDIC